MILPVVLLQSLLLVGTPLCLVLAVFFVLLTLTTLLVVLVIFNLEFTTVVTPKLLAYIGVLCATVAYLHPRDPPWSDARHAFLCAGSICLSLLVNIAWYGRCFLVIMFAMDTLI